MSKPRDRKMRPNPRTKPTIRQLGPRDPGPHGKTVELRESAAVTPARLDRGLPRWMQLPTIPAPPPDNVGLATTPARTGRRGGQR